MDDKTFTMILLAGVAFVAGMHYATKRAQQQAQAAQAAGQAQAAALPMDDATAWFLSFNRLT